MYNVHTYTSISYSFFYSPKKKKIICIIIFSQKIYYSPFKIKKLVGGQLLHKGVVTIRSAYGWLTLVGMIDKRVLSDRHRRKLVAAD